MRSSVDKRAVTPLLGAMFLALIFVMFVTVLQVNAVPEWNRGAEIDHNEQVQEQLLHLQSAIEGASVDGRPREVSISLGTNYPRRPVLRNPAPVTGTLDTSPPAEAQIDNATGVGDPAKVWNGSERKFESRSLNYVPNYNYYSNSPQTVYENWLIYNEFADDQLLLTDQQLIRDNKINLLMLGGDIRTTQQRLTTLEVKPVSVSDNGVTVTDTTGPIVLRVPTTLANETWGEVLEDEYASNGGHIVNQSYRTRPPYQARVPGPYNVLVLTLERGVTYNLHLSKVSVGDQSTSVDPFYLISPTKNVKVTNENERAELVYQARDRFDNPVSDAPVVVTAPAGRFEAEDGTPMTFPLKTDEVGRTTVWYNASGDVGIHTVEAYLDQNAIRSLPERKRHVVEVINTGGSEKDARALIERSDAVNVLTLTVELPVENRAGQSVNLTGIHLMDVSKIESASFGFTESKDVADEITAVSSGLESESVSAVEGERPVYFEDPIELSTGSNTITLTFDSSVSISTDDALDLRVVLFYEHGLRSEYSFTVHA